MFNKNDIIKGLYNYKANGNNKFTKHTKNEATGEFISINDIKQYNVELFDYSDKFNDLLESINITETLCLNPNKETSFSELSKIIGKYDYLFINQQTLANILCSGEFKYEILYKSCIRNTNSSISTYLLQKNIIGAYLIKIDTNNELENYVKIG